MGYLLAAALAILALALLAFKLRRDFAIAKAAPQVLFKEILPLFPGASAQAGETAGTWILEGRFKNHDFQIKAIADTLAARKLPSLWLMVTLPEPQPVKATLDVMMRPAGVTSFSNFDFLSTTMQTPLSFPKDAVLRTDNPRLVPSPVFLQDHLRILQQREGKELLISPKGLRVVVQAAEADRARYAVMREASFTQSTISGPLALQCLETLLALNDDLKRANV